MEKKGVLSYTKKINSRVKWPISGQEIPNSLLTIQVLKKKFVGKGLGKQLIMKAIDFARIKGLKILPLCPFAKKVFDADSSLYDVKF